ncbi:MAG: TIGR04141 family sporadically distributed protein [Candidatus Gastranaerophilales bacterium]|nr:TIGR04141 family sporadically distributed protein [Candidatus Gastranaerophilales bacterium]
MDLNFYLFNENVCAFSNCLKKDKDGNIIAQLISDESASDYQIYFNRSNSKAPKWFKLISDKVTTDSAALWTQYNSAVILIKENINENDVYFAVTLGFGCTLIDKDKIVPNFGLKVVLNSVKDKGFKSIESKAVGTMSFQKREASSMVTHINEFDFNSATEILNKLVGIPEKEDGEEESFANKVIGGDSCKIVSKVEFDDLKVKCQKLYEMYKSLKYKEKYGFIDHVKHIKDKDLIDKLEENLYQSLINRQNDLKISIAYPDLLEEDRCSYFELAGHGGKQLEYCLTIETIYNYLNGKEQDKEKYFKKIKIQPYDSEGTPCADNRRLYDYFVYETQLDRNTYVLSTGKWYEIDNTHIQEVNSEISNFVTISTYQELRPFKKEVIADKIKIEAEEIYNSDFDASNNFVVLDQKLYHNSNGKIEIADLYYIPDKKLIHIKKKTNSSTLSHLFSQGYVSAYLLKTEQGCIDKLNELIRDKSTEIYDKNTINDLTVIYAIATERCENNIIEILPIFSKINLLNFAKNLTNVLGYKVEITQINIG